MKRKLLILHNNKKNDAKFKKLKAKELAKKKPITQEDRIKLAEERGRYKRQKLADSKKKIPKIW